MLRTFGSVYLFFGLISGLFAGDAQDEFYTEPKIYGSRPDVRKEMHFGQVGVTGLDVRIYEGVAVTVEGTIPGSPADGKFAVGEVITGINGTALKGKNPYVLLGNALTEAEAGDGLMAFRIREKSGAEKDVVLSIPVLGRYSATWPLNCKKSDSIIKQAAAFYATDPSFADKHFKGGDEDAPIAGALACLFLLSTGDDQYLPTVKRYMDRLSSNVAGLGDHTWNNGYNGIACAEYYLRTGDQSVLPVLQFYCDNARDRQFFGIGWGHWGREINPRYVASGLMNPAGCQILTTLLLGKECGVKVDDKTLLGALTFWYRFAGHGTVPYGDHRGEGGLGSNGKDGMAAAVMQIASGAQGNVEIYKQARNYFSMSMLTSYPSLVTGHADEGRGDGIWRGMASAYMLDVKPQDYHEVMNRLHWWVDLSRRCSGALGMATNQRFDDMGSGAGVALLYTAPLKTLRITGAARSKFAKDFTLPARLWGREADLAFLSIEHGTPFLTYGEDEPVHIPFHRFGGAYSRPAEDLASIPRKEMLKNVYHKNYMIRVQAAKALLQTGALAELETLLENEDPRIRRAALDGLTDYNYWFAMGKAPIKTEDVTPAMQSAMKKMLTDPEEALYVVDGALMAMSRAPAKFIIENLSLILPWTTHDEWWLRQTSFLALSGAAQDEATLPAVLPTMIRIFAAEYRTQASEGMQSLLTRLLQKHGADSEVGKQIIAGLKVAARDGVILPGSRAGEGAYNVVNATSACLTSAPGSALDVAAIVSARFDELETRQITAIVSLLLDALKKTQDADRESLAEQLYTTFRDELIRRAQESPGDAPLDSILSLTQLKHPERGWSVLGKIPPAERIWAFCAIEPTGEDILHAREKKRFRDIRLPDGYAGWHEPDYDASRWTTGRAPIGTGVFKHRHAKEFFANRSSWGEGEFLLMRTTFEIEHLDYDHYRISVLANQGFRIFLNGHPIHTYIWWKDEPHYRTIGLSASEIKHLRLGTNHLAIYANGEYVEGAPVAQIDAYIEGLRNADLLAADNPPPNIVLIISDDQAWTDYGFMAHPDIKTPNLDQLSRESALFRRGYVPTALCRPSLASLATGLYAHQSWITGNDPATTPANTQHEKRTGKSARELLISNIEKHPTVPMLLAQKGYLSFQCGKWWEGNYGRGGFTHGMTRGYPEPGGRHGDDGLKIGREGMAPLNDFIDSAISAEKPFFIWYAPFLPHTPHNPPARLVEKYSKAGHTPSIANYYAMCEWFDETCGQLLGRLDEKGVADNTLVIYVTDNGWIQQPDGKGHMPRSKRSPYEGGTRNPIMFRWHGKIQPADRPELCSSIDIVPTVLAAAGISIPDELPGLNLLPHLTRGTPIARDRIFGESYEHDIADIEEPDASLLCRWVIKDHFKLLVPERGAAGKVDYQSEGFAPELYNLQADPHEKQNLASTQPARVKELHQLISEWYKVERRPKEATPSAPQTSSTSDRPNILFLLTDDQRNDTLGCAGHPIIKTPVIDRLAEHGVRFSNMFVSHSICWVSRTTILTGLTARSFGRRDMPDAPRPETLSHLYPALLKSAGYRTAHFGKFHAKIPQTYRKKMFDEYVLIDRNPYFKRMPDGSLRHETDFIADHSIKFLKSLPKGQPFAMNLWFNAAHAEDNDHRPGIGHFPWPQSVDGLYEDVDVPAPRLSAPEIYESQPQYLKDSLNRERHFWRWDTPEKYQVNIRAYFRMISGIDHAVGRIIQTLEEQGLADNTIIVYSADNGYYMGNRGFSGKWSHYEESLRVPLIVYDPRPDKQLKRGHVNDALVMNLDLPSTFLSWAGVQIPQTYQGLDLSAIVAGNTPETWREDMFFEHVCLRPTLSWEGVRDTRFKYARYFDQTVRNEHLHDLAVDPDELTNLVDDPEYVAVLAKLRKRTETLVNQYGGPLPKFDPATLKK